MKIPKLIQALKNKPEAPPARKPVEPLRTDPQLGLTQEQVLLRQDAGWMNTAPQSASKTEREIIAENCLTFFNLVFVVLAVVLALGGSSIKNMTFLVVVICNAVIGCVQEIRAKWAVDKLSLMAERPIATVRDGKTVEVHSRELVRDDVVEYGPGDQICADGVVVEGSFQVNESLITGEADPVRKELGDNLKSGSFIVAGRGRSRLTKVGPDSYAARLAAEAKANPQAAKSEMMRALDKLIRVVGYLLVPVGIILFCQEYWVLGLGLRPSAEGTVAALVGMIPEGLYLLTSIAMAASALKLSRQKVLVQDMNCIETLARVDVLCVDKTGTITEPVMEVDNVIPLTGEDPQVLEDVLAAYYYNIEPDNDTDRAMQEMFARSSDWQSAGRVPFTSANKWGAASFEGHGTYLVGAPEMLMQHRYEEIRERALQWQSQGCRVLLVARYTHLPVEETIDAAAVTALALVALTNRIRPEAPETFRYFAQQGVSIRVISGDNPMTVSQVARRAGIENAEKYVDATTLHTDQDYARAARECTVFGRVTPEQKRRLIREMKNAGHTVAMTGDGVNDVLAMKEADCGIAMASGAQAASQVAQLVLLESDFAAMPGIVGEGRRVINNIQRAAALFLVKNIFSLFLSVISLFTAWPYPVVPLHLSIISATTIGIPSFFLALEPNYERVSGRFLVGVLRRAFPGGLTNVFVVLAAQIYMTTFGLSLENTGPICAAILAIVGLLVLFQVCKPFDKLRKLIWGAMALALLLCFTVLGSFLELNVTSPQAALVMVTLVIMTPTVFFAVQRLFDWGDKLVAWARTQGWDWLPIKKK